MKTAIRKHFKDFLAVIGLFLVAAGVSVYILGKERLRFPIVQPKPFVLQAEFQTAQAVIAGQGQTVRVSGVRIGDIGAVKLQNGRAIVRMDIDSQYKNLVHTNATALLRPKTGLKDMFIELQPGDNNAPVAKENWTLPIDATTPDVNPDEILSTLDSDTRDYLRLLISDAGRGLQGRSSDLRDLFRRFEPTDRDLAKLNGAVAERRDNLRRLIHSLNELNTELADHGNQLAGLVTSSAAVLHAFASEDQSISTAVAELPSTLQTTTDTLGRVQRFADILGPATQNLRPAARALDPANRAIIPFAKEVTPLLASDIRPFVREARPVVRDLRPASNQLAAAAPNLTRTFTQLNNFFNLLAYNPNGREDPSNAARQEGYLFWLAWAQHMAIQLFSSSDAHGVLRPVTVAAPCSQIDQIVKGRPELEFLQMLTPILTDSAACNTK
ncbi:MAG: phospholipid/cholesterol/gamma-HCH transport system substrate-binding protein [Solirubrobacteraceae bacterium]|nr:phospholipid/cholesterol/gamma-HCH transport system substrate-binding protein [Solirubrobacteraceae bacterium]